MELIINLNTDIRIKIIEIPTKPSSIQINAIINKYSGTSSILIFFLILI